MKRLFVARHGETEVNGAFCGWSDVPLSPLGKQQSAELCVRLSDLDVTAVVTTGLQRTDYCGTLAVRAGIAHYIEAGLQEVHFGAWEGLTWIEIEAAYPEEAQTWLHAPNDMRFPRGEAVKDFNERVLAAWERTLRIPEETVAIVAHAGVLDSLLRHLSISPGAHLAHAEMVAIPLPR